MQFIDLAAQQLAIKTEVDRRIASVLAHGQYIMGPEVAELEDALASRVGGVECICVASGTEALLIALMVLCVGPGDEVITTPFSFVATAEVIVLLGAKPIFVDIDPETLNIDARLIEAAITPQTKAILPVSLYGQMADLVAINAVAKRHGLTVIEDAAQSFGASSGDGVSCGMTAMAATSFFPSKPLGCYGDGGALFTSNPVWAQAIREIRVHGQESRYFHTRVGVGGRMDTLQCAVVLAKLTRFDWELERREQLANRYRSMLCDVGLEGLPTKTRIGHKSAHAQFTVRVPNRDIVATFMKGLGIPTAIHYPRPIHRQPAYVELCCADCCPQSVLASEQVLSLPMHADLTEPEQIRVIDALHSALKLQRAV